MKGNPAADALARDPQRLMIWVIAIFGMIAFRSAMGRASLHRTHAALPAVAQEEEPDSGEGEMADEQEARLRGLADDDATRASAWGDYNEDGFVDLYVANYIDCTIEDVLAALDATA